jgi:hypothetical protein
MPQVSKAGMRSTKIHEIALTPFRVASCGFVDRLFLSSLSAAVLVLFTPAAATAISIGEYHQNIRQAVTALDSLAQSDENENTFDYAARSVETVSGVRKLLPPKETVEWAGTTFAIDNSWLHTELDEYNKAKYEDRLDVLRKTTERLQALEQRIAEVESSGSTPVTDKEEARRKLKEILQRPGYGSKAKGQNALSRLVERFLKWFQNLFPKPKQLSPGRAGILSQVAQVVVVVLAIGVIAFVLKTFLPRLLRRRKSEKKVKQHARIVLGETLAPDQSAVDLLSEAEALARRGELRAAIRKAYIALLVELGERKILQLAEHKTNRDYLSAVYQNQLLYGNVKQLTDSFERHWYGLTQVSETDWRAFRSAYERTLG